VATKPFLSPEDLQAANDLLLPPIALPSGDLWDGQPFPAQDFASWLALSLEARLRQSPSWKTSHPIAIGSWGRGELCPLSDLDVILCGEEADVTRLLSDTEKMGVELKYRYPKNRKDWRNQRAFLGATLHSRSRHGPSGAKNFNL
jgi:[protein-PII] uridylyltransferase